MRTVAPTIFCENCGKNRPAKGAVKVKAGMGDYHLCASCYKEIKKHCPKTNAHGHVCTLRRGHKGNHNYK